MLRLQGDNMNKLLDTIIVPIKEQNDEKVLKMKKWFGVRISEEKLSQIKYIAFYQTAPKSRILYYARIKNKPIQKDDGYKKYIFTFLGKVQTLNNIYVKSKTSKDIIIRTVRYTNFEKLNNHPTYSLKDAIL